MLHEKVWKRFVRTPGILLDCADTDGCAPLPTAEEIRAGIPNACGWMTPSENGAFFTGLYLYALCCAYDGHPSEALRGEVLTLADGLFLLCDVGAHDGFIARGVAEDGVTHYPLSSEDQVGPWLLGLWRLRRSRAADDALREKIDRRLLRTLRGIRAAGYEIPTEWDGVTHGSYARADWRGVCKGMFSAYISEILDLACPGEYRRFSQERPGAGLWSRTEIASHGFAPDMIRTPSLIQFWIDVCAHLCLRELAEADPVNRDAFCSGLRSNGFVCEKFLEDYRKYDNTAKPDYNMDWRSLIPKLKPWRGYAEATAEAARFCGLYAEICPARRIEHGLLGNMLFGAWICTTCGEERIASRALDALDAAARHVDWDHMGLCYAFAAESAVICADRKNNDEKEESL